MITGIIKIIFCFMAIPFVLAALWIMAWFSAVIFVIGINLLFKMFGIDINKDEKS